MPSSPEPPNPEPPSPEVRVLLAFAGWPDEADTVRALLAGQAREVATLTLDLGQGVDLEGVRAMAIDAGAARAHVIDARELLVTDCLLPALRLGAACDGEAPLSRELSAVLIARTLVEVAGMENASAIAHATPPDDGEHLDRLDELVAGLRPDRATRVIAASPPTSVKPSRDSALHRTSLASMQRARGSLGVPPSSLYHWSRAADAEPDRPASLEIAFERGVPIALNGVRLPISELIDSLNLIAGGHGVGRFVGMLPAMSARWPATHVAGEAPALLTLGRAYEALEQRTLPFDLFALKQRISAAFRELLRRGRWFTPTRTAMLSVANDASSLLTGVVTLRMAKGGCQVVGVITRLPQPAATA